MNRIAILAILLLATVSTSIFGADPKEEADCAMFGFDAERDSPQAEILAFRYGNSGLEGTFSEVGKPAPQHAGVAEGGLKGERLLVKWKNKQTGKTFTKDVALKGHLPNNNKIPCQIFFAIKNDQLYVFLLSDEPRPKDWPPVDLNSEPLVTDYLKVFIVYPYGKKMVD